MTAPAYISPQWVLLVADGPLADIAEDSLREDFLDIHRALDLSTFDGLVSRRKPSLALVDIDVIAGEHILLKLLDAGVQCVIFSESSERMRPWLTSVTMTFEKPYTSKGISKIVNFLLGRK